MLSQNVVKKRHFSLSILVVRELAVSCLEKWLWWYTQIYGTLHVLCSCVQLSCLLFRGTFNKRAEVLCQVHNVVSSPPPVKILCCV